MQVHWHGGTDAQNQCSSNSSHQFIWPRVDIYYAPGQPKWQNICFRKVMYLTETPVSREVFFSSTAKYLLSHRRSQSGFIYSINAYKMKTDFFCFYETFYNSWSYAEETSHYQCYKSTNTLQVGANNSIKLHMPAREQCETGQIRPGTIFSLL